MRKALRRHYGGELSGLGLSWYRDGRDVMGAHRDSDLRWCESTLIAVLTLGAARPWTLRSRTTGQAIDVAPAAGDLLVMGGGAQADWLHGVPPCPGLRAGRISVQWRWTSRSGRPETGGSSRAPRRYGGSPARTRNIRGRCPCSRAGTRPNDDLTRTSTRQTS